MNKVILIGNLGDDIKMHQFDETNSIGRFPIATTESYTSRESGEKISQTEWHNIVVRNKLADICSKYLKKGDKVYVEGRLKTRKWQDSNNQDRYTTEVIASEVLFLTTKGNMGGENMNNSTQQPSQEFSKPDVGGDDDLPF